MPADPPTFQTVAPICRPGRARPALHVVEVRDGDVDDDPVLVVGDVSG